MHELGIVIEIFDLISEIAEEQKLKKIDSVTLEIGELSGIIPDYLSECWKVARADGMFSDTNLITEIIPAVAKCACGEEFEMIKNNRVCPKCGKSDYKIIAGKEFTIKQIEAY
ncbi:MAG: hydrogenase maturation nickel metallochaperone HypA [Eubacterium sp.]